ncbi:MAG: DUF1287 domain-containing protein [Spirulina sp. SIO3F2]|nr:DUF1287 domain-containing protein [Spirulina sp. SIO3F2]
MNIRTVLGLLIASGVLSGTYYYLQSGQRLPLPDVVPVTTNSTPQIDPIEDEFFAQVVAGAIARTSRTHIYDPSYVGMDYPNGDVPDHLGVCTDVVVRSFRNAGVDLQQEVHEDMAANFSVYPPNWGLTGPDSNIDHRRVPNLMTFFERHNAAQEITRNPENYQPGDVIAWRLSNGLLHMGMVINERSKDNKRYLIVHNMATGTEKQDVLFAWKIIGHYRYNPNA